jgi:hypothetical protein
LVVLVCDGKDAKEEANDAEDAVKEEDAEEGVKADDATDAESYLTRSSHLSESAA